MSPYVAEEFAPSETDVLRRYFTNLDQPVFALVNLPEVVKGALFARYSRSPKSLRRLFLDEFVGELDISGDECVIPPNSFALARTVEYFRIPRNVLTICLGKSTYARCGIIVNVTPLEPEWEGHVTLEFSNTTTLPAKIYANEGVAQMLFFESS